MDSGLINLKNKEVIIYGLGQIGQPIACYLSKYAMDVHLIGVCASDVASKKTWTFGEITLPINNITEWKRIAPNASILIATAQKFHAEITKRCQEAGFESVIPVWAELIDKSHLYTFEYCCNKEIEAKKLCFYDTGAYSGHGKYITEQLLRRRNDLDIVWIVKDKTVCVPQGVRAVEKQNGYSVFSELATAKICVFDFPWRIGKRAGQVFINVKHWASVTLKTFGAETHEFKENNQAEWVKRNGAIMDYMLVGSRFDRETCQRAFGFQGEFVDVGSPRSDALFYGDEYKDKFCRAYGLDVEKKLLLYAPTFRRQKEESYAMKSRVDLDFERLKYQLENKFGGDWYILLRLHPYVASESAEIEKPPYVIDVSRYSDSQELVAASDMMITDYSSIMFEPAFVRKPVFLLATDLEDYRRNDRDLLIDYHTLPFPIAESNEELMQNVKNFDYGKYVRDVDAFMDQCGVHEDGHASERAAQFISDLIDK